MLNHGKRDDLSLTCYSINIDLLCLLIELGDHNGMQRRNFDSFGKEELQLLRVRCNTHRRAAENIRWPQEHRVSDLLSKPHSIFERSSLGPFGLVHIYLVKQRRELMSILSPINIERRSPKHTNACLVKR